MYSPIPPALLIAQAQAQAHACACHAGHEAFTQLSLPLSSPLKASGIDELELMHYFATETYQTLCVSETEARTWQVLVPRLVIKY
jgi:hypothetical protein